MISYSFIKVYPIPPHFNHLGSDIARSIILLAEGKKLGPKGLDTLKVHLINLIGTMKKSSIDDRLAYANSIIEDIIDSAEKPFTGRCWWKKSGFILDYLKEKSYRIISA